VVVAALDLVRWKLFRTAAASGRLSGMAFKVRFTEDRDRMSDYDTGDVYDFLEGGVLSIAYAANKESGPSNRERQRPLGVQRLILREPWKGWGPGSAEGRMTAATACRT
jgi:hypothetical protein